MNCVVGAGRITKPTSRVHDMRKLPGCDAQESALALSGGQRDLRSLLRADFSLVDMTIYQLSYCMMAHRIEVQGIIE